MTTDSPPNSPPPGSDPGWGGWSVLLLAALPGPWRFMRPNRARSNGLVGMRFDFLRFVLSVIWIGVIIFFSLHDQPERSTDDVLSAIAAVAIVGILALTLSWRLHRPLACTDERALSATYRTRFFLRVALAVFGTLAGFTAAFAINTWWLYLVGLAFAVPGFTRAAPSARNIANDQAELDASGCSLNLTAALTNPPPRYPFPTRP